MARKFEQLVFYIFIFCIPLQTRLILDRQIGEVPRAGFGEWTAAFLHATDILIILLLAFWLIRAFKTKIASRHHRGKMQTQHWFLAIFFVIAALSITQSDFKTLSFYQLLKLAEFIALYFYIRSSLGKLISKEVVLMVLVAAGVFQAIIAILQYAQQAALGLKIFGESPITAGGYGVASFYVGDQVFLRAYGTLPHPNVLAIFLMISLFAFIYLYFNTFGSLASVLPHSTLGRRLRTRLPVQSLALLVCSSLIFGTLLYAFFLTYSRTVIGLTVLVAIILLIRAWTVHGKKIFNKNFLVLIGTTIVVVVLFLGLNWEQAITRAFISSNEEAVTLRIYYDKLAGETTGNYPWLGTGLGTFVPKMMKTFSQLPSYFYQPVHNIYLLLSSEIGIFGLIAFLAFIFFKIKNYIRTNSLKNLSNFGLLLVCLTILAIGLFDHLPLTIQQGRILLWLVLALL